MLYPIRSATTNRNARFHGQGNQRPMILIYFMLHATKDHS